MLLWPIFLPKWTQLRFIKRITFLLEYKKRSSYITHTGYTFRLYKILSESVINVYCISDYTTLREK